MSNPAALTDLPQYAGSDLQRDYQESVANCPAARAWLHTSNPLAVVTHCVGTSHVLAVNMATGKLYRYPDLRAEDCEGIQFADGGTWTFRAKEN